MSFPSSPLARYRPAAQRARRFLWTLRRRWLAPWISLLTRPHVRRVQRLLPRPTLRYLELHLTDHCNLSCKGCDNLSTIAEPWFADLGQHRNDMGRLSGLFSGVKTIRLLGGEPLLHPQVVEFLGATRRSFPKSDVRLVTNGVLLASMRKEFWAGCGTHRVAIDVSLYPPLRDKEAALVDLARKNAVELEVHRTARFHAHMNPTGDSDPESTFRSCRAAFFCPVLRDGRLHICWFAPLVHHFNRRYGSSIPSGGSVSLYEPGLTGWDVLAALGRPSRTCGYCSADFPSFDWSLVRREAEAADWYSSSYR